MTQYSVYALDGARQVARVTLLECGSDEEAGLKAAALVGDRPIELWNGTRRIGRFDPPAKLQPRTTVEQPNLLSEAVALHKACKFEEAEALYEVLLEKDPHNPTVLGLSGTLELHRNNLEEAVRLLDLSLRVDPRQFITFTLLGEALAKLQRHNGAVEAFQKAIPLRPQAASAHIGLGHALVEVNRPNDALASFETAINLAADNADAHFGRGNALKALRRDTEALESYDNAIALKPDHALAHLKRGLLLAGLQRLSDAAQAYDRAIALKPDNADAHRYGADLCRLMGNYGAALALYDNAIALRPTDALAHHLRAYVLRSLRRFDEALESSNRAVETDPSLAFAPGERLVIQMNMCSWRYLNENAGHVLSALSRGELASVPFALLMIPSSPEIQRRGAELMIRNWYALPAGQAPRPFARRELSSGRRRLRVAYVSANYHPHPVARHLAGLIENHDPSRFETFGISLTADDGTEIRSRIAGAFHHFVEVNQKSDDETAAMMREMEIDIAVDLMSFTTAGRPGIFARRAAPIQVNYLGYPGTTGADYMDYLIADETVIPKEEQAHYSEKIAYLPDTYMPNDSARTIGETPDRAKLGLPEPGFVFCSINNSYKFTPQMFDVWMRLLAGVENSVLWLPLSNAAAVRNLDVEAEARGIDPKRLVFATYVPKSEDHLARLRQADLFLDTLPYNAHSTACEALWAGVPLLTCKGTSFAGRVAASLLSAIGLPELVTNSLAEYEEMALKLARNPALLAEVKAKLANNRNTRPLFDGARYARHVEAAYTRMWERHARGDAPAGFTVEPVAVRP